MSVVASMKKEEMFPLDLRDALFLIPIHPELRPFL